MKPIGPFPTVRVATTDDLDGVVATLTSAFFDDPLWGPAFPDLTHRTAQASALWRLFAGSALRYPFTFVTENTESTAVWIPPGGVDLTESESVGFESFLVDLVGEEAANGILVISAQFEEVRPTEPHFYLSLLATHRDHRGRGFGMGLLRENLERIDALGGAAHLESSNPVNDARYRSVGFERQGEFTVASGHVITTMWRSAR